MCRYEARAGPSCSHLPPSGDNDSEYEEGADCIDVGKILNSNLRPQQKIRILKRIYDETAANPPSQTHSSFLHASRRYKSLLTEVEGDNDDSEVQARRARASLDAHSRARSASSKVPAGELDVDMQGGGEGMNDGEDLNGAPEPESDAKASLGGEVGAEAQDSNMAVLEDGGEGADVDYQIK
ncbi:hypothetical protein FRC12_015108 [Ceratobasidium sp. 428]|nr:hypothetical protein FRC12_015108 [Ceratobasidium sp. 428]